MKLRKIFFLVCVVFFSLTSHCVASPEGRYKYVEYDDVVGELVLFSTEELNSTVVKIQTASTDGYTCDFAGLCNFNEGKIVCVNADVLDDSNYFIEIHQLENALKITHMYPHICGMRGSILGKYIKK